MATKPTKKKPAKPSAAKAAPAKVAPRQAESAVIPFASFANPLAAETLRQFTPATPSFESPFGSMETMMNNYKEQAEKYTSEASNAARQGVESCVKCSTSLAKGAEQMFKTVAEMAQEAAQRNAENMKALMACRTLNEFTEAQNKMMQQSFDDAMSTATKLSEMAIKICNEAVEPLNGQMTKAMRKMSEKAAA